MTATSESSLPVLVATHRTQGSVAGDSAAVVEGELVLLGPICDGDSGCNAGHMFLGFSERKGITTAVIAEVSMTREEYIAGVVEHYRGIGLPVSDEDGAFLTVGQLRDEADQLLTLAASWPVGTVLGLGLDRVYVRELAEGAAPSRMLGAAGSPAEHRR